VDQMESVDEAQEAIVEKDGIFEFFFVKNPSTERTKPDAHEINRWQNKRGND